MRELTEKELKLAPDWATHYYSFESGTIQFESADFYARVSAGTGVLGCKHCNKDYGISGVPMPFDITKHEFGDPVLCNNSISDGRFCFSDLDKISINKQDAIAIAKALGVTAEDLK